MQKDRSEDIAGKFVPPKNSKLEDIVRPHVESFNFAIEDGLMEATSHLNTVEVDPFNCQLDEKVAEALPRVSFWFESLKIDPPSKLLQTKAENSVLYPTECRERMISYKGTLTGHLIQKVDDRIYEYDVRLGQVPIMVQSKLCNLHGLSPKELIAHKEEGQELGGYFICNGIERLIRLLILPRRNYVSAMYRTSFKKRGPMYTEYGCVMRCTRRDQSSQTITLHYLTDGTANVKFFIKKQEFFVPCVLLLKAFCNTTDSEIFKSVVQASMKSDSFAADRMEIMLAECRNHNWFTQEQCLDYLGQRFRVIMNLPSRMSNAEVGLELIKRHIFIHLDSTREKFDLLVFMIQKLYSFVKGDCKEDSQDSLMGHEVLLPGNLYLMILKEKVQDWLGNLRFLIEKEMREGRIPAEFQSQAWLKKMLSRNPVDVGRKLDHFLLTGNVQSETGLDLQQVSGFTIVAEKLNYLRYLSHFASIHRGQFFMEMKTTAVRKLLPETWGFLCCVHTPDGGPCGLLNHLCSNCMIPTDNKNTLPLLSTISAMGLYPVGLAQSCPASYKPVFLDGKILGKIPPSRMKGFCEELRHLKRTGLRDTPKDLEIVCVDEHVGLYAGVYLFTSPSRFVRPVRCLATGDVEYVGAMEQVFLDIACTPDDFVKGVTTHQEYHPTAMLSMVASLTPFSDFNQSPRNMYQCQMGKQTMGTPSLTLPFRTDNKLYRIQTPQSPLVKTGAYDDYDIDDHCLGTNAVVAIISYTGYDMEDAMILNKSSFERGFGHGSVYKTKVIDLNERRVGKEPINHFFTNAGPSGDSVEKALDLDGFPFIGTKVQKGDPLYSYVDERSGVIKVEKYKDDEPCVVEGVTLMDTDHAVLQKVALKLRFNRNPVIGDKFSSRHGQKGVMSRLWPLEDMPFSDSGMSPDVIINPHAFPSRMTIGMLVESLAGKSGALHGNYQDATPFQFNEENRAIDYFGDELRKAGYSYYGNETLYSGVTGDMMTAEIFIGVVYYQRLRHMVGDKFQCRATGPINQITHQPVKGRKFGGGVRFGEMERDALIAHGTSFLLQDRLFNCSDACLCHVCRGCGSVISPVNANAVKGVRDSRIVCNACKTGRNIVVMALPYVFRFLATELSAMNIKMALGVSSVL